VNFPRRAVYSAAVSVVRDGELLLLGGRLRRNSLWSALLGRLLVSHECSPPLG
jgi:hypothetical protein